MPDSLDEGDLTGIGEHRPDHRRGYLVFASLPDALQRAEDSTLMNDRDHQPWHASMVRYRGSTAAERALLSHVLGRALPADVRTRVRWVSENIRNRSWPSLGIGEDGELR